MRRSWRVMSALAMLVAATSILLSTVLFVRIQGERERAIRSTCEGTNERHKAAVRTLDELIAKAPPSRRARAKASRDGTVLLIEALVPLRDCERYVREQVGKP